MSPSNPSSPENHKKIENPVVTAFLKNLFSLLNEKNLHYAVIRNAQDLPDIVHGDLDILINLRDLPCLKTVLKALEDKYAVSPLFHSGVFPHFQRTYCMAKGTTSVLKLDFQFFVGKAGFKFIDPKDLLKNRTEVNGIYVLTETAQAGILMYHSILYKKYFRPSYARQIFNAYKNGEGNVFIWEKQNSPALKAKIEGLLKEEKWDDLLALRAALMRELLLRHKSNFILPLFIMGGLCFSKLRGYLFPGGAFLAFIGPDGCGKSTITEETAKRLSQYPFPRVKIVEMGFQKKGVLPTERIYNILKNTFLLRLLWPPVCIIDFFLRYFIKIRPILAQEGIVIADRYIYNIGTGNSVLANMKVLRALAFALAPKPDICYVIKRNLEKIAEARPSRNLEELAAYYRRLDEIRLRQLKSLDNNDLATVSQACVNDTIKIYQRKSGGGHDA